MSEVSAGEKVRTWLNYEASMTLAGLTRRFNRNQTFICNLEGIFEHLCRKFEILCNFQRSLHFFINPSLVIDLSFLEGHLLPISASGSNGDRPKYKRLELNHSDSDVIKKHCRIGPERYSEPYIVDLAPNDLSNLLGVFNGSCSSTDSGILIPFNYGRINMGFFILWRQDRPRAGAAHCDNEMLRSWVATYYAFLQSFLTREYQIFPQTYLPSYYSSRWAKAAILFADIRNFTPLTEVLRNAYAHSLRQDTSVFREIMDEHCREMANIIQNAARGRIDKFLGDGIMAIFGEHEPDNGPKAVCRALAAAAQMVNRFDLLKPGFLEKAFGGGYETEYNESVELELGVGIDYGTVLFEYLGDDQHREYTAVGDHVNFAQRLEAQAARYDDRTKTSFPPILISRTAERCARPWLINSEVKQVIFNPKGKGQLYKVFGMEPSGFHQLLYEQSEQFDNWNFERQVGS